jgi:hypothetical protein
VALFQKTNTDNPAEEEVTALREYLSRHPSLWKHIGNLAENAARNLINSVQGTPALKEALKVGYEQMRLDLGWEEATALERLLIEQVVLSWMRLYLVEHHHTAVMKEQLTLQQGQYWEGRLNAAQRRFLRACASLARIRKMDLPALQINFAEQQVNQVIQSKS